MLRTLPGLDAQAAEDALVLLARHVPREVVIGRPFAARRDGDGVHLGTSAAWWWSYPDRAQRLLGLPDGRPELTTYRDGAEVGRVIEPEDRLR